MVAHGFDPGEGGAVDRVWPCAIPHR